MTFRATALLVSLVGLTLFATTIQTQPSQSGRSAVYGRAVYSDNDRPVGHATVVLRSVASYGPEQISSTTNGRGEFRIEGVPAGRYFIAVVSRAVVSPESFLNNDENRETLYYLDDMREYFEEVEVNGRNDKQVVVRARRGAVIDGKVTYANGDPAVDHPVTILRRKGNRYSMFWTNANGMRESLTTDDRGMFRVSGLPAAEYIVGATPMLQHGELVKDEALEANMVGSMLAMTFHPSTPLVTQATVVRVAAGEERTGIDVMLAERQMHKVSGIVRARDDNRPVAGARVHISRKETFENVTPVVFWPYSRGMPGVNTDELGRWRFTLVPDGQYIISVKSPSGYELNPEAKKYGPTQKEIEISGNDLANVLVEVGGDSTVSGTIALENSPSPPNASVGLQTEGPSAENMASVSTQRGRFVIRNVPPGKMYFFVNLEQEVPQLYLKSITWKGKDLLREPLEVGVETHVEDVQIVLSPRVATFNFRLHTIVGRPASDVSLVLVPADPARWIRREAQLFGTTDSNGHCTIVGAPAEYLVFIMPFGAPGSSLLKDEIEQRAAGLRRVSLRPGERGTFDIVLPRL